VDCGEFLQTSHPSEAKHRPLSSSKRLVGILNAVIELNRPEFFGGRFI
jgi:hypothetical protein